MKIKLFLSVLLFLFSVTTALLKAETVSDICSEYNTDQIQDANNSRPDRNIPYGDALLWKITGSDGEYAYLFGTMHSQDRLITALPPPVRLAIVESRQFAIEVLLDEASYQLYTNSIKLPEGENLEDMVTPEIWLKLVAISEKYQVDANMLKTMKPWSVFTLIGRPRPVRAQTQDDVLIQFAQSANKPMTGLESMQDIISALDSLPTKDQIVILNDTVCNHKKILAQAKTIRDFYIDRNVAAIIRMNDEPHHDESVFERYMDKLVYSRNRKVLEKIISMVTPGGSFIAIGASHLPDEQGILNLLAERGYKIEAVF